MIIKSQVDKKPGKERPEDIVGYTDTVFWLLDGATMPTAFSPVSTWEYTNALSRAIRKYAFIGEPKEILKSAISEVAKMFPIGQLNPSSTAIIVCITDKVKYGVLGDSTLYINGKPITDNRIKAVAQEERNAFKANRTLENHKELIKAENKCRNKEYYIAEYDPNAADKMIYDETDFTGDILLMSDGLAVLNKCGWPYEKILKETKEGNIIRELREVNKNDDAAYLLIEKDG